jgi:enoyl-CoA hydratase/carnithine racemase
MDGTDHGRVTLAIEGPVARVTFDRPAARNAMTFAMYAELLNVCDTIDATPGLRAAVFSGAADAFVAGTDIAEFAAFRSGEDGVAYERRVEEVVSRLERLSVPTLAAVDGAAMGGGLVLAAVCDIRIVTIRARFGVPIARTLGNCLSAANLARLARVFGAPRARALILLSEMLDGSEAKALGFAFDCVPPEELRERCDEVLDRLTRAAPLTLAATRTLFRRLETAAAVEDADVIARVYASEDFRTGAEAFLLKRANVWKGR